jgi:hypothetical protein
MRHPTVELTCWQRWLLIGPPSVCLGVVLAIWLGIELTWGNLAWLRAVGDHAVPAKNEPVMTPGTKIIARTPCCELTITAGRGLKRSYTWRGGTRSIEMRPRDERWNGSMGLYSPGAGGHWREHEGVRFCVAEEGQMNFSSQRKAMAWLSETPAFSPRIYRNDGLTVWVHKNQSLGVDVFQVYINGRKPRGLPGARDEDIVVVGKEPLPDTTRAPADSSDFNEQNAAYRAAKASAKCFYPAFFDMAEYFYHKEHNYAQALECYNESLFAKPTRYIYLQRARCLNKLGRYREAAKSAERAKTAGGGADAPQQGARKEQP